MHENNRVVENIRIKKRTNKLATVILVIFIFHFAVFRYLMKY